MPIHPQAERFFRITERDPDAPPLTLEEIRSDRSLDVFRGDPLELPSVTDLEVAAAAAATVPVRVFRPEEGDEPLPVTVYLHGGGWVAGGIDVSEALCTSMARAAGCTVVSVGYRLAPEHRFPAALDDARAVLADVAARPDRYGIDAGRIAIWGDSAGGNLAAVTAQTAPADGVRLVHQLLVYPITDTGMDTASYTEFASGYGLNASSMGWYIDQYVQGGDRFGPRIAPLRAHDIAEVAPATIITAEYDVLRDEGEAYAARLAAAGVPVAQQRFEGVPHGFFGLPSAFDATADARNWAAARLREAFGNVYEPMAPRTEEAAAEGRA
ncbi:MAG: alpha/beta hydrolase fold domain-containing protein [Streptosporangiales bacterium]|nr:alpha/beta hydrolase fold domain-containing protein [Streptosporangiales bacterium]